MQVRASLPQPRRVSSRKSEEANASSDRAREPPPGSRDRRAGSVPTDSPRVRGRAHRPRRRDTTPREAGSAFMRARAALDPRRLLPRPGVRPFATITRSCRPGSPSRRSGHPRAGLQEVLRALPLHHHGPQGYVTFPHRARVAPPHLTRARSPHTSDRRLSPPDRAESRCELLAPPNLGGIKKRCAHSCVFRRLHQPPPRSP